MVPELGHQGRQLAAVEPPPSLSLYVVSACPLVALGFTRTALFSFLLLRILHPAPPLSVFFIP